MPRRASLLALVLLAIYASAGAFGLDRKSASARVDGSVLFVNGVPVAKLKATVDGLGPSARGAKAASVLLAAASPGSISFRAIDGKSHGIYVGYELAITVVSGDGGKPIDVCTEWAARIKRALSLPAIKVSDEPIRLPLGTTKEVPIYGSLCDLATVTTTNSSVATVEKTTTGFTVKAVATGKASVIVSSGANDDTPISVIVQPYAATYPQTLSAFVSGSPSTASTIEGAIQGVIQTQLQTQDGAKLDYKVKGTRALGVGRTKSYTFLVHASAPHCFDSYGEVNVVVRNTPVPAKGDEVLWYSNDPESVKRPGPLFSSELKPGSSARLLYHHLNASSQTMLVRVQAVNDTDKPVRIQLIPGDSRPDRNPVRAGMRAAMEFIQGYTWNSGEVVTIPSRSTIPLSLRRFAPGETVSGLCSLRLIDGDESILVRTDAWPSFALEGAWQNATLTSTPWREIGSRAINQFDRAPYEQSVHVYPNPYKREKLRYEVGGRFGTCRIGEIPIATANSFNNLDGNYGVIYNIDTTIDNPTNETTDVELVFESSAGYTTGLFLFEGKTVYVPYLGPKEESRIASFHLGAGASKRIEIVTLPISGGSYPITLTLRPRSKTNSKNGT